jgi:gamma-glutamyltranspeptidase/glutathione hydrolase
MKYTLILLLLISSMSGFAEKPKQAGIASAHPLATAAGHEMLSKGGNAFDAAVAMSSTLAVVEQQSSGIGGGAFWLLHRAQDGKNIMIDGRETAPAAAHRDMYLNDKGEVNRDLMLNGPLAAAIPGEIAGLAHIAEHYGKLPLKQSLQPAIRAAENGFEVYPRLVKHIKHKQKVLNRYTASQKIYLPNKKPLQVGDILVQKDLANTLKRVAEQGAKGFYQGKTAQKLVQANRDNGGIWTLEDLKNYTVKEREVITTTYRGQQLITSPPPSSGGIALATMLNIIEPWDLTDMDSAKRIHLVTEAMRRAYRDRSLYMGDPDFVDIPTQRLTHPYYAAGLRAAINPDKAMPSVYLPGLGDFPKGEDTTHFSVIDTEGNLVAATLTVNTGLASGFVAAGTGVLLNNEMDDFSAKRGVPNAYGLTGGEANQIEPAKRPLSSMTPTFVVGDDGVAVLGTPGGSRIITMVMLAILDYFDGHDVNSWVHKPRYHHQYLPDTLYAEKNTFDEATLNALKDKGHQVKVYDRQWGNMHAVHWNKHSGEVTAASDPRTGTGSAVVK